MKLEIILWCIFLYLIVANAIGPISIGAAEECGWKIEKKPVYLEDYKRPTKWLTLIRLTIRHIAIYEFCSIIFCLPSLLFCIILLVLAIINACTPMPKLEIKEFKEVK